MTKLEKNLLENTLFSNELALHNLVVTKCFMKLADDDPHYLQAKHNIEEAFERHKQEYKELTGDDYVNRLNHNMFE
jgi:hypothetical protein